MPEPDAPTMMHEPADLVEAAHDLRIAPEKYCGVLLLDIGESGVGSAARLEGEARRIKAGAFQTLLQAPIGLRLAGKIDELLVGKIKRNSRFVDSDESHDHFLAHLPGGVDLRLAPAGRQPLLGDERDNHFATIGGLLQRFLPALAGHDAALGVEV